MKILILFIIITHGLLHFLGFVKAFDIGNIEQLTKEISKPMGMAWLLTGLLFIASAGLNLMKKDTWTALAIVAVVISQILIITIYKDAKFGTIANAIIMIAAIIGLATNQFENSYKNNVASAMEQSKFGTELITEKDLEPLPLPIQKYLAYVGAVGQSKIYNVKIVFEGEMREKGKDWFKFTSEQFNFFEDPTRLFFMKAIIKILPTHGYHKYTGRSARMNIKLLSLVTVAYQDNPELFPAETVTFFNDLCLFAPAALIDERITWETINHKSVKATFTNMDTSISAILYFNETGQLVNFISDDRLDINQNKNFRFSTPVKHYKNMNGFNLPTYGEAVWYYPDGEFVYGKFRLKSIMYNVSQ